MKKKIEEWHYETKWLFSEKNSFILFLKHCFKTTEIISGKLENEKTKIEKHDLFVSTKKKEYSSTDSDEALTVQTESKKKQLQGSWLKQIYESSKSIPVSVASYDLFYLRIVYVFT